MKFLAVPCFLALCLCSRAQSPGRVAWLSGGKTWQILGSQDIRNSYGLHVQWTKADPRLSFRQNKAQLVSELYYMHSAGGRPNRTRDIQYNFGILALGRFELGASGTLHSYWECGWGLQYINRTGPDINLHFNSTPCLGAGLVFPTSRGDLWLGARYLHISNAGLKRPNQGQNWLQVMLGASF